MKLSADLTTLQLCVQGYFPAVDSHTLPKDAYESGMCALADPPTKKIGIMLEMVYGKNRLFRLVGRVPTYSIDGIKLRAKVRSGETWIEKFSLTGFRNAFPKHIWLFEFTTSDQTLVGERNALVKELYAFLQSREKLIKACEPGKAEIELFRERNGYELTRREFGDEEAKYARSQRYVKR